MKEEKSNLESIWDKTLSKNNKVNYEKVTFHNCYGITFVADMYKSINYAGWSSY